MDYKEAGVDIAKGDQFAAFMGGLVKRELPADPRVVSGIGGFSALYEMTQERYLALACDGVGTKLKIAQALQQHQTIGIDLVAMCVNDLICCGARPLVFLDYFATSALELDQAQQLAQGIVEGCRQAGAFLIGGETAEMPGLYQASDYDLAGFCVGEVLREKLLDGSRVAEGDTLLALASSGLHSNGYSLFRKLFANFDEEIYQMALTPTKIYVKPVLEALESFSDQIVGLANITGGGVHNIGRINKGLNYQLQQLPPLEEVSPLFKLIQTQAQLPAEELYRTFNMGMGMVLVVKGEVSSLQNFFETQGISSWRIGTVAGPGEGLTALP